MSDFIPYQPSNGSQYSPTASIYGLNGFKDLIWEPDFRADRDANGLWSGSESFTCKIIDLNRLIPAKGFNCQFPYFEFLTCDTVSVENIEGDCARVTINFNGSTELGEEELDEDGNPIELGRYTYSLAIANVEEPIETNYYFRDLYFPTPHPDAKLIQNFKEGKLVQMESDDPANFYTLVIADSDTKSKKFIITNTLAQELFSYIVAGVETYRLPQQIWRATVSSKSLPSSSVLNKVGKITSAKGAPSVSQGRNWLFNGCDVSQSGDIYTITYEWQLSGPGGWDDKLY